MNLKVDLEREDNRSTGIYIRATKDGKWGSHDIYSLNKDSLLEWLGKDIALMENVILALLDHKDLRLVRKT